MKFNDDKAKMLIEMLPYIENGNKIWWQCHEK